ncbi:hypothetical protein GL325_09585 [Aeromicrobium sp. 636]|uniref:Uncharacterized protein n=1 Tax=Aeromicrobium senzhongii TaxID=2663859 RepID=A0A8I0EUV0_9ACTN|nr:MULTISPECIES: hypothetical protein [Aeromicrobium]MBC9226574.1 hypothetical protein [Aeromicrobium senzhongii]MCQ3998675.1 hypothetical protein [Aeromicrobium sp. 636]MTB89104.1 hypothetical protein [Aeromicrobium senzhongii]QNL93628.1 hypothetical protein H9L21_10955 [Aeromicrobium senzhongii]
MEAKPDLEKKTPDADDLTVDPQHEQVGEPGGGDPDGGASTVPGVGADGVPDLPVTDDPGTGGPGEDEADD